MTEEHLSRMNFYLDLGFYVLTLSIVLVTYLWIDYFWRKK